MKHTNIINKRLLIGLFFSCLLVMESSAMSEDLRSYKDSGIIGEKKTLTNSKVKVDKRTGISYQSYNGGILVTPKVEGDTAYFNLNYDYAFSFKCLDWKYDLSAVWSSPNSEERTGLFVNLISPDKKIKINLREIDIPVGVSLSQGLSQEKLNILQSQSYVEDPFIDGDQILAAQEAIKWILKNDYGIVEEPKFTQEQVNHNVFVRAEFENATKKCTIWALNRRGYRLRKDSNIRRMYAWIYQVVGDSFVDSNDAEHMVLETIDFNPAKNMFSN